MEDLSGVTASAFNLRDIAFDKLSHDVRVDYVLKLRKLEESK